MVAEQLEVDVRKDPIILRSPFEPSVADSMDVEGSAEPIPEVPKHHSPEL